DWPQALKKNEANASELLERDRANILKFFKRRYNLAP
ncbi:MAG: RIO1 family regulatory kinase/ATPase domain-containing protein, partial [Methanosarcinales archaeon]